MRLKNKDMNTRRQTGTYVISRRVCQLLEFVETPKRVILYFISVHLSQLFYFFAASRRRSATHSSDFRFSVSWRSSWTLTTAAVQKLFTPRSTVV